MELDRLAVSESCLAKGGPCLAAGRRFPELDLLRGLAVVGMVVFHFFFILDFYGVKENEMFSGWWHVLGQFVRFSFLGLVGVSMVISYERVSGGRWRALLRQWKRAALVFGCGIVITIVTRFAIPEVFVRFGILHMIGVSIFLWSFFVEWKWVALGLSLLSFWAGGWFEWLGVADFGLSLSDFGINRLGLFFLKDTELQSIDYFPLFPWTGIVGVGIFIGRVFYGGKGRWAREIEASSATGADSYMSMNRAISFIGKKALLIYLLHVPVFVGVLWVAGLVRI